MLLQGFEQMDFIVRTPNQIKSWPELISTLVALTEVAPAPSEESVIERLRKFQT